MQVTNARGVVFTQTGVEPYTTKIGRKIELLVWEACCANPGCREKFTVKTPKDYHSSKAFGAMHCKAHRATRDDAWASLIAKSRKITDAQVAEIRALIVAGYRPDDIALVYPVSARTILAIKYGERR